MKFKLIVLGLVFVVLKSNAQIGNFAEPAYKPHFLNKVITLPSVLSLKNQYMLNECYLYAYVHFLEHGMLHTRKISSPLSISAEYLFAQKMYEIIDRKLKGSRSDLFFEGGHFFDAIYLTEKYGLVPESVWKPKKSVFEMDYAFLNKFLDNPKTKTLSEFSQDILELQKKRTFFRPEVEVQNYIEKLKEKYLKPLYEMFGDLPKEFLIAGKVYTPVSYAEEFDLSSYTKIHVHFPKENHDVNLYNQSKSRFKDHLKNQVPVTHDISDLNQMKEQWKHAIDQQNPVFLNLYWGESRHGMVIVGYEISLFKGEIIRFKLQNSWGREWSSGGFAWYTPEDLYKNLISSISVEASSVKHDKQSSGESALDFFQF